MNIDEWLSSFGMAEYVPSFRANHIGMDALVTLNADDLKDLGVASLGHRKMMLAEIDRLVVKKNEELEAAERFVHTSLLGGMWFDSSGHHYRVAHSEDKVTPVLAIAKFINEAASRQPLIASWIMKNYPRKRSLDDETLSDQFDDDLLAAFWPKLSLLLIRDCNWWLAWRGYIYGRKPEAGALHDSLKQLREAAHELNWHVDARVKLVDVDTSEEKICTWGDLLSPPVSAGDE